MKINTQKWVFLLNAVNIAQIKYYLAMNYSLIGELFCTFAIK